MTEIIYFDTGASAKWYLNEARSDDVERYIQEYGPVAISELTVVEMRCLLARRERERGIDLKMEIQVFTTFQKDICQNILICHSLPKNLATGAVTLLSIVADVPLRVLDALHLMVAKGIHADVLATADKIIVASAKVMGFSIVRFD